MHSLTASITSALALKPSTVYILRVEDTKTKQSWHLRRCFSEFCELREKLLALIDEQMATYLTSAEVDSSEISFSTSSSGVSNSSASTSTSISRHRRQSKVCGGRFAYLFKQFPPRKLFGSRSKRVIESRSQALNLFLSQALDVVEVVRQRQLIAVCFSMITHLETFLECGSHRKATPSIAPASLNGASGKPARQGTESPSAARRASAAMALTRGFHHYPLVPTPSFTMTLQETYDPSTRRYRDLSSSEDESSDDIQRFNNFDFTRRFYREFGRQEDREEAYSDASDDEEIILLKKTWSAIAESETRERVIRHTGSHFSMLESGHSPPETWAKRVEIAGIATKLSASLSEPKPISREKISSTHTNEPLRRHRSAQRIQAQRNPTCA
ncbi:hypothetical protein PHYBOEH_004461 [Phytophthora boehmeriae]|uniref:PX domain-containing protein n=1 Tax=Phytophthora boehmeriae TaxID=109152 RepID=A0A8T1WT95_9STRA|nr:hypothetical protein PHYBOEH_004461 [Phytophthora boehmeriae]